jgi:hypothetical protein
MYICVYVYRSRICIRYICLCVYRGRSCICIRYMCMYVLYILGRKAGRGRECKYALYICVYMYTSRCMCVFIHMSYGEDVYVCSCIYHVSIYVCIYTSYVYLCSYAPGRKAGQGPGTVKGARGKGQELGSSWPLLLDKQREREREREAEKRGEGEERWNHQQYLLFCYTKLN